MNWKNSLGFGIAIWVIMFVIVSIFIAFNFYYNFWGKSLVVLISGVLGYLFGRWSRVSNWKEWSYVVLSWLVVGLFLDYFVTAQFQPEIFGFKSLWFGYLFLIIGSLLGSRGKRFSI